MTLFDSIKYPISDQIRTEEVNELPQPMLDAIASKMNEEKIYSGKELSILMRSVILNWEELNDNL